MGIVGIGIVPAVEPLRAADAIGDDVVERHCRTSPPYVFAIDNRVAHANPLANSAVI